MAADTVTSITAANQKGDSSSGAGGGAISEAALVPVSMAITEIVKNTGIDETLMFCIGYLSNTKKDELSLYITPKCLDIIERRAALDNNIVVSSFSNDESGRIISDYLDQPQNSNERVRRIQLAQSAAGKHGFPTDAIDLINFLAAASPTNKLILLAELRNIESDVLGKAALSRR